MTTTINNNQAVFMLRGTGWNSQQYFCNLVDIVKCAKEYEKNQPYIICRVWNGKLKRLSVKSVIELLESNQYDASFFKKTKKAVPA